MTLMEAIDGRRSVRSYAASRPDKAVIGQLLTAAVRAPTAMHEEPCSFVVIRDEGLLKSLSDRAKALIAAEGRLERNKHSNDILEMVSNPDFNIFYDANTLIVVCVRPMGSFVAADAWLATENLLLAAYALGLGTCVIGFAVGILNTPEVKKELGIPADVTVIAPVIVGTPAGESPVSPRKAPDVLAWR
jgi:nitroreductase